MARNYPAGSVSGWNSLSVRIVVTSLSAVLETYSLEEILELNDLTSEEVLEYLVQHRVISLPEILPVEFDD